jgi:hypothetical protein
MAQFWMERAYRVQEEVTHRQQAAIPSHLSRPDIVCKYWLEGLCRAGEGCRFLHLLVPDKVPWCKYGLEKVRCPDGAGCVYRHS